MTTPARPLLPDLPKGYEFPATTFTLSAEDISRYLNAVADSNALYLERASAPPLAVAAKALRSLLDVIVLPAGTLHAGQEMEARGEVEIGSKLTLTGRIVQRSERAGAVISVIEFEVAAASSSAPQVTGRTTVIVAPAGQTE